MPLSPKLVSCLYSGLTGGLEPDRRSDSDCRRERRLSHKTQESIVLVLILIPIPIPIPIPILILISNS